MAITASGEEGDPTSRYQNPRYSGKGVPDRGDNPKRKINFYHENGDYSHTADVRWLSPKGYRSGQPHGSELKKHMPHMGGWSMPEYDSNPKAPKNN